MSSTDLTTFYISIASSSAFLISEVLPFINGIKSNGILHCLKICLENCSKAQVTNDSIEKMKNDINTNNDVIVNIKSDVNEIKNEVNTIKTDIKDIKSLFDNAEIV